MNNILDEVKQCIKCNNILTITSFSSRIRHLNQTRPYYNNICKQCIAIAAQNRRREKPDGKFEEHLLLAYDLTIDDYKKMLETQNSVCAICLRPERRLIRGVLQKLSVDHDHKTGEVRALLCHSCNIVLGHMDENIVLFKRAITYLKMFQNIEL